MNHEWKRIRELVTGVWDLPAPSQLEARSPVHDRLAAVMSIQPPEPTDGEVRCLTLGCRSGGKLKRTDLQCWWCGGTDIEIVSEELKVWMRIPEVKPVPLDYTEVNKAMMSGMAQCIPPSRPSVTLDDVMHTLREMGEFLRQTAEYNYERRRAAQDQYIRNYPSRAMTPEEALEASYRRLASFEDYGCTPVLKGNTT